MTIPDKAIKAAFERYVATPDDDDDGITWSTVELMLRDALPHLPVPVPTAGEGKARVFTEKDVRAILDRVVAASDDGGEWLEQVGRDAIAEHESELTEEVIARSAVDRLVALALVWGAHDYRGIPAAAWESLEADGLVRWLKFRGDQEFQPQVTDAGEAFLRAELERDR